jgi:hypothetical protein
VLDVLCLNATPSFRLLNVSSREHQGLKPFAMGAGSTLRRHGAGFPLAALLWRRSGASATLFYGTTVAPCTAAIPSTQTCAGSCTALRSKARRVRAHDRTSPLNPPRLASFFVPQAARQLCCSVLNSTKNRGDPTIARQRDRLSFRRPIAQRKWAYNDGTLFEFFRAIGPTG